MDEVEKAKFNLAVARFWSKVEKSTGNGCWNWNAGVSEGYGVFSINGKPTLAHRFSWTLANGPIPKISGRYHGAVVMHACDNRLCVNPDHLRLGTQSDNVRDMIQKGRKVVAPSNGEKHGNAKFTDADVVEIRLSGKSDPELAAQYGVTPEAINYARTRGWRHIKVKPVPWVSGKSLATRGDRNANARLNAEIVREIRASADKPGLLAKKFGITPDYVTLIRKRKAWLHVD